MYFIYILYSKSSDRYYVGQSNDVVRRLEEHNTADKNSYTSRHRPWVVKAKYQVSDSLGEARKIENYIKRLKSRKVIEKLIEDEKEFEKILALVRAVPMSKANRD